MGKQYRKIITSMLVVAMVMTTLFSGMYIPEVAAQENIPKEGGSIYYGTYVQDKVTSKDELEVLQQYTFTDDRLNAEGINYVRKNGNIYKDTPIEWQILQDDGECYVLMSKKILEIRRFSEWNDFWDASEIRGWLNGTFLNSAFTEEEQEQIEETTLSNITSEWGTGSNPYYPVGDDKEIITKDKVFLLSSDDVQNPKFEFSSGTEASKLRVAYKTQYLDENEGADRYWLRGGTWSYGQIRFPYVAADGSLGSWYATYSYGVRPIIRVKKGAEGLSITRPKEKGVNVVFEDSSIELNKQVADLFRGESSLGKFTLNGPEVEVSGNSFNIFKFDCEVSSPFCFDNTDFTVKYDSEERKLQVLVGFNGKWKKELDQSSKESPKWKDAWENTKSLVIGTSREKVDISYTKPKESLKDSFNETWNKVKDKKSKCVFEAKAKILGYFEFEMGSNRKISRLTDGGVILSGSVGASARNYIWTIVYVEGKVKGELEVKVYAHMNGNSIEPKADVTIAAKPSIALGANAVVADVQGGLKGTLSSKVSFPWKSVNKSVEVKIDASVFVKIDTLIGLSGEYSKTFAEAELWPEQKIKSKAIDLKYRPTQKVSERDLRALKRISENKIDDSVEDSVVYEFAHPQMQQLSDGRQLLVYLSDSEEKAVGQNTLMYRIYENGKWSDAKAVFYTERMDTMAKFFTYRGKTYIIYQNSEEPLSQEMSQQEIAESMEIYVAEFNEDTQEFKMPVLVGKNNGTYKYNYLLCERNGELCAMWAENSEKDVLLEKGNTEIYETSLSDTGWTEPKIYKSEKNVVDEFIYGMCGGKETFVAVIGKKLIINGETYTGTDEMLALQLVNDRIYYLSSENCELVYADINSLKFCYTGIQARKNYYIGGEGVYWVQEDEFESDIVYQSMEKGAVPISITDEEGFIGGFQMSQEGNRQLLVYTLQSVDDTKENPYGRTIMKTVSDFTKCELTVDSVSYDALSFEPGKEHCFTIGATNSGTEVLHNIRAVIKDMTGNILLEQLILNKMNVGEQFEKDVTVQIPEGLKAGEIIVELTADEELKEQAVTTRTVEQAVADLKMQKINENEIKITNCAVDNQRAEKVIVQVYDQNEQGVLLKSYDVGELASGEAKIVNVTECYNMATKDKETNLVALYCFVSQKRTEYRLSDNSVLLEKTVPVFAKETELPQETVKPTGKPIVNPSAEPTDGASESPGKKVAVPKVKNVMLKNLKKKKLKCTWKKVKKASFYTIEIAMNRKFTKGKKKAKVLGTKYTRKSLKKKTYYVRIRAWYYQSGKNVAGKWSNVKKVKVRK